MTRQERILLSSIVADVDLADDKIDALERLYFNIKRLLK